MSERKIQSKYLEIVDFSPHRICKWTEIETLWHDKYWNAFAHKDYIPQKCKGCKDSDKCDGGCREAAHVYFGGIDDIDPCFDNRQDLL